LKNVYKAVLAIRSVTHKTTKLAKKKITAFVMYLARYAQKRKEKRNKITGSTGFELETNGSAEKWIAFS